MPGQEGAKLRPQKVSKSSTGRTPAETTVGHNTPAVASPYACYLATGGCGSRWAQPAAFRGAGEVCVPERLLSPWYLAGCCFGSAVKAFCNSRKSRQRQAFARNQEPRAKRSPFQLTARVSSTRLALGSSTQTSLLNLDRTT